MAITTHTIDMSARPTDYSNKKPSTPDPQMQSLLPTTAFKLCSSNYLKKAPILEIRTYHNGSYKNWKAPTHAASYNFVFNLSMFLVLSTCTE
jgi:hypothetical protein